jgi:hypothetical protein
VQILLRKPHAGRVFALVVCVYGIGIVGLTFWYFSSFAYLWQWVRGSLEIINGYSSAMSLVGPSSFLVYALVVVMGVIYSATCLRSSEPRSFCFVMGLSACLFIAFREGFVRQDAHAAFFFPFVLALISGMLLHTTTRRGLRWNTSLFLAVFAVTGVVSRHHRVMSWQNFLRVASGQQGANNLISLFSLSKVQHALDQQSHVMLKRNLLPPDWIQTIERGNTVNVLPSEIAYLPANQLSTRWRPSPTLQSYSAYTASLDHLTARAYSNDTAPGSLLVTFHDIDARHLFWSTPATWQAILRNYTVREVSPTANLLLLQRQSAAGGWATREREQREERVGHWIDVPQSSTLLFLDLTMQLNTLGTLAKSLFRISPVYVDVLYESGRSANYRLIPDTAKNGILINYLPQSVEECAQIFRGVASDRVTTFRISGPGTKYYQPTVKLTYKESPLLVTQLPRQSPVGSENLRLVGNATRFSIDSVNDLVLPKRIVVVADHDEMIRVSGWAVDAEAGREAGGVFLSIDGKLDVPVSYGSTRADVARHFGNAQYERSGFSGTLLASRLGKGHHSLHLKIVTTDKIGYYLSPEGVTVEIQ